MKLMSSIFGENEPDDTAISIFKVVSTVGIKQEEFQSYTCIYEKSNGYIIVNIGDLSIKGFENITYINIVNIAIQKQANKVYFVVSRSNLDSAAYRDVFKLLDLKRTSTKEKKSVMSGLADSLVYSKDFE